MVQLTIQTKRWLMLAAVLAAAVLLVIMWRTSGVHAGIAEWQQHASPGPLSSAHSRLQSNCAACHSAVEGPDDAKCVACHANNTALVQRQPTAFHAEIKECAQCHIEHQGADSDLRRMDHVTLARVGLETLKLNATAGDMRQRTQLLKWLNELPVDQSPSATHPEISALESTLNCQGCHATKEPHSGLFGKDCASCHATQQWTITKFRHPSPRSTDCAQCHQAPPSHYMMHFDMVSKRIAGQQDARVSGCCGPVEVSQCQRCHQTTSWNDIKGVGWYKHH